MSSAPSMSRSGVIRFNCSHCGVALTVPLRLAGVRGECPSCRQWVEAPRSAGANPPRAEVSPGFESKWVIEQAPDVPVDQASPEPPSPPPLRRRPRWRRRVHHSVKWLLHRRAIWSTLAVIVAAGTLLYFKHLNWQLPWRLNEKSALGKWLTSDEKKSETPRDVPRIP